MFTINYKGAYIHGYCDKEICRVSCTGIPNTKEFKSMHSAKIAISKAVKKHDADMVKIKM